MAFSFKIAARPMKCPKCNKEIWVDDIEIRIAGDEYEVLIVCCAKCGHILGVVKK